MNNEIKKLALSSIFLALCGALVLYQIPMFSFYKLDFSFVFLLMSRRFVGIKNSIIISLIYPWFTLATGGEPIGASDLVYMAFSLILIDYFFNKNKTTIFGAIFTILIWIFTALLGNMLLFFPLWFGGWNSFYNTPFKTMMTYAGWNIAFNLIKLPISIVMFEIIYTQIRKVI